MLLWCGRPDALLDTSNFTHRLSIRAHLAFLAPIFPHFCCLYSKHLLHFKPGETILAHRDPGIRRRCNRLFDRQGCRRRGRRRRVLARGERWRRTVTLLPLVHALDRVAAPHFGRALAPSSALPPSSSRRAGHVGRTCYCWVPADRAAPRLG